MNKTRLIIEREYLSRVKKKSFIIMTLLGPVLIAGLLSLGVYLGMSDSSVYNVLVIDQTASIGIDSTSSQAVPLFWNKLHDTDQMKFQYSTTALTNAEFDSTAYSLMLVLKADIVTYPEAELVFRELPSMTARSYIKSEVEKVIENEKLKINAIDKRTYDSIRTNLEVISVNAEDGTTSYKQEQAVVGFVFAVMIYFFIFLYGVQVMRGVMEEKSNRIVEVLISSVKPFQLMMGKIVGIALVGLTQFLIWVILTTVIFSFTSGMMMEQLGGADSISAQAQMTEQVSGQVSEQASVDPMQEAAIGEIAELIFFRINWPLMIGMFLFYFLGGYLLYAALFAAVGAAVDNEAETQQFMLPITIPLVFGFIVSEFALQNPEGSAVFWFSQFPLTSPIVMMVRVAMGFDAGSVWQLLLSMALLIVGFLGAVWLAAKIYRVGILLYGKKITYKELLKWLRYKS